MLLALIMLTSLDGSPIWVESNQVQIVRPATQQCKSLHGSGIQVGTVAVCVRETPDQIRKTLEGVNAR